jgi:hypothetical protein
MMKLKGNKTKEIINFNGVEDYNNGHRKNGHNILEIDVDDENIPLDDPFDENLNSINNYQKLEDQDLIVKKNKLHQISRYSEDIQKLTSEIQDEINDQANDLCNKI